MARKPCASCGVHDRAPKLMKCVECWLAVQPAARREAWADRRLASIPVALRITRIPAEQWPPGRRWCAGCQTFVRLGDVSGSRCKTCAGRSAHAAKVASTFGITADEYAALLTAQGGKCYICQGAPKSARLAVDHDHATQEIRGLLCSRCNHDLLGAAHDSINILRRAVAYLETPPSRGVLDADRRFAPGS